MDLTTPTVYVPTLNGGENLAACLEALSVQSVEIEVVVADNGPGEGCSELLKSSFPSVTRVSFGGHNLGFGTALNRAVTTEGQGPIIFLNDDAVPDSAFVENLLVGWNEGETAMVAGVLLKSSSPTVVDSAGIRCDRTLTAWDHLTGEPATRLEVASDPLGPTGGAALFDRVAFETIGGFDERIFLYYEDLDLALRMRMAGYSCRLARAARATHESSATLGRRAAAKYRRTGFSRGYLLRKYGIMAHPGLAIMTLISDGSASLAQLLHDRTAAGLNGRIEGWQAGRDIVPIDPPFELLEPPSLRRHMRVRLNRRRY
ncbi:MAG TPA: glycosyltransferase family 2 protein, partial [Solirubrobacterales bacterium]|jgi:GT2 family glycosyltransferase|nr:glycosyltransferase family 2 protein [Solirubrobacterales bacterium]HNC06804.1 glycosyltransferase family 2 protein [Solirubrobacterales bacterium]HNL63296.1 glycosyltransferase family 2 protein [Solirubrobacterales bacterium]HNN19297.1 glycosyltransferase family 2 protein [Solirubrobacterales bacterium]